MLWVPFASQGPKWQKSDVWSKASLGMGTKGHCREKGWVCWVSSSISIPSKSQGITAWSKTPLWPLYSMFATGGIQMGRITEGPNFWRGRRSESCIATAWGVNDGRKGNRRFQIHQGRNGGTTAWNFGAPDDFDATTLNLFGVLVGWWH